jgi:hypothetical protein
MNSFTFVMPPGAEGCSSAKRGMRDVIDVIPKRFWVQPLTVAIPLS